MWEKISDTIINLAVTSFFRATLFRKFYMTRDSYGRRRPRSAWRWRSEPCWGSPGSACRERASIPNGKRQMSRASRARRPSTMQNNNANNGGKLTTYCKVPLEGFGSPVVVVSTDFTVVVDVESVEFVEPVWNWLEGGKNILISKNVIQQVDKYINE